MHTGRSHESQDAASRGFRSDGVDQHLARRREHETDVAEHQRLFLKSVEETLWGLRSVADGPHVLCAEIKPEPIKQW